MTAHLVKSLCVGVHQTVEKEDVGAGRHLHDDLYIIGAVCISVSCDEKVTSSLICSAKVAGEIYI